MNLTNQSTFPQNLLNPSLWVRLSSLHLWLQYMDAAVLKRSLLLALIIGGILTLVNQPAALFSDAIFERLPLTLAFVTPFVVITVSQLGATHQAVSDAIRGQSSATNSSFITTLFAHNILLRALVIGLTAAGATSLLTLISTFSLTGNVINASLPLLIQAFVLPFVFGTLSQTLAYRRYVASLAT